MKHLAPFLAFAVLLSTAAIRAEETVVIDPAKAAQLRRLEPLTPEKIDVFVDAGQLSRAQADLVKRNLGPGGALVLPASVVVQEAPRRASPPPPSANPPPPATAAAPSSRDPYAALNYKLPRADQDRLRASIREYRQGNRAEIGRELRKFRPEVNALIAEAYPDPIDLPIKVKLWEEVAGPGDAEAAIGLFETHRAAYDLARPVLIPYEKDVGGVVVRRRMSSPDARAYPPQQWMDSRSLRELILDIEGLIARCSSPSAATFLMDVYSQRYNEGEAPMRDKGRDRHRLVEACGGNPKKFDEDETQTWNSTLNAGERAAIAERLIPWLHRSNGDRKKIARNGLMICLQHNHPDWDAGRDEWERWWKNHKDETATR